ncbi:MAG: hypothetical protein ABSA90_17900 [Xanthobacteraceae bacterium]
MSADLQEAVYALLRAASELSREQERLSHDPELAPVARDHAMGKVVEAFRAFESGAKAITKPTRVSITLSPR